MQITYNSIGIIKTPFTEPAGTPIQAAKSATVGTIEINAEYADALLDLDGFSHIILIYHFHLSKTALQVKPFMDDAIHGSFAVRSPSRPNNIGISVVQLDRIEDNVIYFTGADVINGTPVLDIKPFVPEMDHRDVTKIGWFEKNIHKMPDLKDDGRFVK